MTAESARTLGKVLQGVLLGVALFLAVLKLLMVATGGTVFRYQGF